MFTKLYFLISTAKISWLKADDKQPHPRFLLLLLLWTLFDYPRCNCGRLKQQLRIYWGVKPAIECKYHHFLQTNPSPPECCQDVKRNQNVCCRGLFQRAAQLLKLIIFIIFVACILFRFFFIAVMLKCSLDCGGWSLVYFYILVL